MSHIGNDVAFHNRKEDHALLYLNYYQALLSSTYKYGLPLEDREDVVNVVIAKTWQIGARFSTWKEVKAFLYVSVRNGCIDKLREKNIRNQVSIEAVQHIADQADPCIDEETLEIFKQLVDVLREKLSLSNFVILEEMIMNNKSAEEIAAITGWQVTSVRSQRKKALDAARKIIEEQYPHLIDQLFPLLILVALYG
ncbi:MAG: sigma-70 family RNA polymerase sigma factor [Candidatus Pseudobacter hemicellulosilyticus]|uniref:Sigma-70 family RNA polymerase sigma factor n=1 Tax=Candidatus Pseudobacter hemicellulosilyticus TaxID=3121375 RepID=A0AAJ6BIF8_9BACT|nr:MAG: sigma-70 family RNA polymerase sigma factor [Pseudobacter sp.]